MSTTTQNLDNLIEIMAELALKFDDSGGTNDQWIRGAALEVIETFVNEGICEMTDESRDRINKAVYELLLKPVGDRAIELNAAR